jgi:predicted permease
MNPFHSIWIKLRWLGQRRAVKQEIDEELRFHLEQRTAENIAAGMSSEEAAREARRLFGNFQNAREQCREVSGASFGEATLQDLRFGVRMLRKNPGFTIVAVLTLALGIGANTAIFSIVNCVLLKPLPFRDADEIVTIQTIVQDKGGSQQFRWDVVFDPDFKEWREQNHVFQQMAAYGSGQTTLLSGGEPERIGSAEVTVDFFALLGVRPLVGRTFLPEEHQLGGPRSAMLGEHLWRDRFGGNPSVIGRQITLDGQGVTVVGVLPDQFKFPSECDVWTSMVLNTNRGNASHRALARLKPGVTLQQAQAEMDTISHRLAQTLPASAPGKGAGLVFLQEQIVGSTRSLLFVFLGAVGFVLLIACANVANLLLARAATRQKEVQIRVALGASRLRIARQLLTESILLAAAGGVIGLLLALGGVELIVAFVPPNLVPRIEEVGLDARMLGFNFGLSFLTGIAFGLAPAWQAARSNPNGALKAGGNQSSDRRQHFLRQALVAAEISVSIVLLLGAGLMLKSFSRLHHVKLGFNPERTLTLSLSLPSEGYPNSDKVRAFYREALEQIQALPGVRAAALANAAPLGSGGVRIYGDFSVEGQPALEHLWSSKIAASHDYFRTMGIPLLKGRFFTTTDDERAPGVAIISERLARFLWPNDSPLGKRLQLGIGPMTQLWLGVVGVVGDVRQDDLGAEPPSGLYVPYQQVSQAFFLETMTLVVRTAQEPRTLAVAIRKAIQSIDPTLPIFDIHTMDELVSMKVGHQRFDAWLLGGFSAIALMLALVGIYGVVSYGVTQRTREIGIRLALGAQRHDVIKVVVSQGMKAVLIGVLCGTLAAIALTRLLAAELYSVRPTDPTTFACVVSVFIGVALASCLIPARRAARVNPVEALRYE